MQKTVNIDLMLLAVEALSAGDVHLARLVAEAREGQLLADRALVAWMPWAVRQREFRVAQSWRAA